MTPEIFTAETDSTCFQCRHIFTDGRRCGSPAIRGPEGPEPFCYYHHNSRRPVQDAPTRRRRQSRFTFPNPADFSDRSGIQLAIGEVLRRIASNDIDPRRAGLLLYGLQIASRNLPPRTNKPSPRDEPSEFVTEVTHDPEHGLLAPPAELGANKPKGSTRRLLEELDALDAKYYAEHEAAQQQTDTIDLRASAAPEVPAEATPAQTVQPARPSKSNRPINSPDRKERSHEPCSTPHRIAASSGRTPAGWPTVCKPGAPAPPDLHRRRSGRSR